jgi:hypothetical protein
MVEKMEIQPLQTNDKKCAFGHFYHIVPVDMPEIINEWHAIDQYHHQFHKIGDQVIEAIANNDVSRAKKHLEQAKELSKIVIDSMHLIIDKLDSSKVN